MADLCSAGKSGPEYLADFQFMEAVSCTYIDQVGLVVTATLIFGTIFAVTYIRTDTPVVPFVLLLVTGGAFSTLIASPLVGLGTVMLLLVGGGMVAYLYHEWSI